jgi:SAM-dependent methyltransferase
MNRDETSLPASTTGCGTPGPDPEAMRDRVRDGYARIATAGSWSALQADAPGACCPGGGCCGPATFTPEQLAQAIGYASDELAAAPDGANLGLSCGNPSAIASLRPGETVLDLGAGAGFDVFIAGAKVGATGRAIGVDMTPEMLRRARGNVAAYTARTGLANVEFRLGEIERLPVADASVDAVISNCVLNLSPDKPQVWREIARVLRPGGRVAISDLALLRPLPAAVRDDLEALVGCIAGAVTVEENGAMARAAGLVDIRLEPKGDYVGALVASGDPLYRSVAAKLPAGTGVGDFVTSLSITARKDWRKG